MGFRPTVLGGERFGLQSEKVLVKQGLFAGGEGGNCVMYTTPYSVFILQL